MCKTDGRVDEKRDTLEFEGQEALDVMKLYGKLQIEDFDEWVDERVVHDHVVVEDVIWHCDPSDEYVSMEIVYVYIPRGPF